MVAALLLAADVAIAATPTKFLSTPRNEGGGTADDKYKAYYQSRLGTPHKTDAYLKPPGQPRIKVNADRTIAYYPNLEIGAAADDLRLVFTQESAAETDIKIWDVDAEVRRNPPPGVNTTKVESKPSLSGDKLLFGRGPRTGGGYMTRVILFDLGTATSTVLDTAPVNGIVFPGTVNGDWASWTECSRSACWAWRYEISTETKTEVPSNARLIYTSAVGADGTVWFVQSGIGCGVNVKIRRAPTESAPTTLVDFPDAVDANVSDLDDSGATHRLYFDRVNCSNVNNWAIYHVPADG